jgi:hypothetical protein
VKRALLSGRGRPQVFWDLSTGGVNFNTENDGGTPGSRISCKSALPSKEALWEGHECDPWGACTCCVPLQPVHVAVRLLGLGGRSEEKVQNPKHGRSKERESKERSSEERGAKAARRLYGGVEAKILCGQPTIGMNCTVELMVQPTTHAMIGVGVDISIAAQSETLASRRPPG